MQSSLQLGRSSATGCSFSRRNAAAQQPRRVMMSSTLTRQPLLVQNKFSNPFDGMFSGNKGGDSDAARRAIEVSTVHHQRL